MNMWMDGSAEPISGSCYQRPPSRLLTGFPYVTTRTICEPEKSDGDARSNYSPCARDLPAPASRPLPVVPEGAA